MDYKKLPHGAYGGISGSDYVPLLSKEQRQGEASTIVIIIGLVLAALFAGANAYLGLMSGMTVAAGIPGAILGSGLLLMMNKRSFAGTNTMQVMSSGGESVASGIIFVLPAVILMGSNVDFVTGILVGIVGVGLGAGFTSFLRKYLTIQSHGELIFPESMAISETILTANAGGFGLKVMAFGALAGSLFTLLSDQLVGIFNAGFTFSEKITSRFTGNTKYQVGGEVNPALVGVGFIVGKDVGLTMIAGAILSNLVLIVLIGMFAGYAVPETVIFPSSTPLVDMSSAEIFKNMIKYIGAGAIATGGIISVIKLLPVMIASIKDVVGATSTKSNDDADMSPMIAASAVVGTFIVAIILSIFMGISIAYALVGAFIAVIMTLLFTVVAARLTGQIGTSNLPVSGMTIASLLVLAPILTLMMNGAGVDQKLTSVFIILILSIVVTAISTSAGFSQSLKATFIIGGSAKKVELLYTIGGIAGVFVVTPIIMLLSGKITSGEAAAPQANLMNMLTKGIVSGQLPWLFIFIGVAIAIALYLIKVPVMSFAIGMYLPMSVSLCVLAGGFIRYLIDKRYDKDAIEQEKRASKGIIFSSGLIAGGALTGLALAVVALLYVDVEGKTKLPLLNFDLSPIKANLISLVVFIALGAVIYLFVTNGKADDEK